PGRRLARTARPRRWKRWRRSLSSHSRGCRCTEAVSHVCILVYYMTPSSNQPRLMSPYLTSSDPFSRPLTPSRVFSRFLAYPFSRPLTPSRVFLRFLASSPPSLSVLHPLCPAPSLSCTLSVLHPLCLSLCPSLSRSRSLPLPLPLPLPPCPCPCPSPAP